MNITTGKQKRPQRLVVYTPEGFGKSTLGSKFPAPLFLDMEKGGTDHLDVARVTADNYAEAKEVVAHVTANPSEFGTLVVDTADWLEKRIIDDSKKLGDLRNNKTTLKNFWKSDKKKASDQVQLEAQLELMEKERRYRHRDGQEGQTPALHDLLAAHG